MNNPPNPRPVVNASADGLLEQLNEEIRQCQKCPLHQTRQQTVPGEGPSDARLMLVGEAPGANEDATGRPFVGDAGRLLDEFIDNAGLRRSDFFIANTLKCRPPNNRDPLKEEAEACRPFLERQIEIIQPALIVTAGAPATNSFIPKATPLARFIGKMRRVQGRTIFPVYHPAAGLRNAEWKNSTQENFVLIPHLLEIALLKSDAHSAFESGPGQPEKTDTTVVSRPETIQPTLL